MATTNTTVTTTWSSLATGPTTRLGTVQSLNSPAEIAIATSLPAESFRGFRMNSNDSYSFTLESSESLYGRSFISTVNIILNPGV